MAREVWRRRRRALETSGWKLWSSCMESFCLHRVRIVIVVETILKSSQMLRIIWLLRSQYTIYLPAISWQLNYHFHPLVRETRQNTSKYVKICQTFSNLSIGHRNASTYVKTCQNMPTFSNLFSFYAISDCTNQGFNSTIKTTLNW